MKLNNPVLLNRYMKSNDVTGAWLGRRAGVDRRFIWSLRHGVKPGATREVAQRIETALGLLPGTLFSEDDEPAESLAS